MTVEFLQDKYFKAKDSEERDSITNRLDKLGFEIFNPLTKNRDEYLYIIPYGDRTYGIHTHQAGREKKFTLKDLYPKDISEVIIQVTERQTPKFDAFLNYIRQFSSFFGTNDFYIIKGDEVDAYLTNINNLPVISIAEWYEVYHQEPVNLLTLIDGNNTNVCLIKPDETNTQHMETKLEKQERLLKELEQVKKEIEEENTFKVGDYVTLKDNNACLSCAVKFGEVLRIDVINYGGWLGFDKYRMSSYDSSYNHHSPEGFRKATKEEIEDFNKFKEGDYVVLTDFGRFKGASHCFTIGNVYELGGKFYKGYEQRFFVKKDDHGNPNGTEIFNFRKATKEEIEEYLKPKEEVYTLSGGHKITIGKNIIWDGSQVYTLSNLKLLVKPGVISTGIHRVELLEAQFQIGCQKVSKKEIEDIIKIAERLNK